jgi:hypothetical protein
MAAPVQRFRSFPRGEAYPPLVRPTPLLPPSKQLSTGADGRRSNQKALPRLSYHALRTVM